MSSLIEIKVPDIGDFADVEIIEILVSQGDQVKIEDPLVTLESDKATMEIPSSDKGLIHDINVTVGQRVSEGTLLMRLTLIPPEPDTVSSKTPTSTTPADPVPPPPSLPVEDTHSPPSTLPPPVEKSGIALPHASPAIRRFARELGADLSQIRGSGAKGRILKEDVTGWVKQQLNTPARDTGTGIPSLPEIEFSQFGEIETVSLSRIKKRSGPHLHAAWLNIPHVTHHDEADITELEAFRQSLKVEAEKEGIRITLLAFVTKILCSALKKFPSFNASLHPNGDSLILKKYFNIGIAVDTPQGLVVPVLKDVDRKSIFDLAREMGVLSTRARESKLTPEDLKGSCMTISSLGGIGGSAFTPIVNAPEVAILGISRARMMPVWDGKAFEPRLILPLDLSYDHRVIDGAEGARFAAYLTQSFGDVRRLSL